jgi:hypothetical protein
MVIQAGEKTRSVFDEYPGPHSSTYQQCCKFTRTSYTAATAVAKRRALMLLLCAQHTRWCAAFLLYVVAQFPSRSFLLLFHLSPTPACVILAKRDVASW